MFYVHFGFIIEDGLETAQFCASIIRFEGRESSGCRHNDDTCKGSKKNSITRRNGTKSQIN